MSPRIFLDRDIYGDILDSLRGFDFDEDEIIRHKEHLSSYEEYKRARTEYHSRLSEARSCQDPEERARLFKHAEEELEAAEQKRDQENIAITDRSNARRSAHERKVAEEDKKEEKRREKEKEQKQARERDKQRLKLERKQLKEEDKRRKELAKSEERLRKE